MESLLPLLSALFEFFFKLLGTQQATGNLSAKKWGVLHNLPKSVPGFVGRKEDKEKIHRALRSEFDVASIEGIGGVGKSTLAIEVAHECLGVSRWHKWSLKIAHFRGIIWASAKDREFTENTLLDTIAITLDQSSILQLPLEAKRLMVKELFRKRTCLLIVDNFETIADPNVRLFLTDLPGRSKAIVTTRKRFLDATPIPLGNLSQSESLELIRREGKRFNLETVSKASDEKLLQLFRITDGTPLALKWAIGQIKQKGQSLEIVLVSLQSGSGEVFEQIFERSWELLKENENARTILKIMPLFAAPVTRDALKAVSGVEQQFDDALGQLVEMSLVDDMDDILAGKRYGIHPLTRVFSLAALDRAPQEKEAAVTRLAAFYKSVLDPLKIWSHGEGVGYPPFDLEIPNIFHIIDLGLNKEHYDVVKNIFNKLWDYLFMRGYWNDMIEAAVRLSTYALGDGNELEWALLQVWPISSVYRHRGQFDLALNYIKSALETYSRYANSEDPRADALRQMGKVYYEQKRYDDAEKCLQEAHQYYLKNKGWDILIVTVNLAELALAKGNFSDAQKWYEEGVTLSLEFKDPERKANLSLVMGQIQLSKGDLVQARQEIQNALEIMSKSTRLDGIADSLFWLAKIEKSGKDKRKARSTFTEALTIYKQLGINNKVKEVETELSSL
jgi:predicted negative regulator of RcsB-dependent stress response